jgi:arylsulfatase A-like enzyme/Tfp pilus assembly protein PilF
LDYVLIFVGVGAVAAFGFQKYRQSKGVKYVRPQFIEQLTQADRLAVPAGAARGYNVLLITLDTTRADALGCYGNLNVDTPALDRLARQGALFTKAYTSSPTTLPSHSSIHTGLYPYHHGARANGSYHLAPEVPTLAEMLKEAGYRTAAFISSYVLDSRFGVDQGFESYDDDLTKGVRYSDQMFRERPAEYTNERVFAWLDEQKDSKFFLWVHYFDAHAPYLTPEPFRTQYAKNPYAGQIAYLDTHIDALLKKLEEKGIREKTLVVVAGDHGESLGEHGEMTHGLLVYDGTLRIPLIFNVPGAQQTGLVVDQTVSNTSIAPTILDLLDIRPAGAKFDGVSLLDDPATWPRAIYSESIATLVLHGWAALFCLHRDNIVYIHAPKPELYDIRTDPAQAHNLFSDPKFAQSAADLSRELDGLLGGDKFGRDALKQMIQMDPQTARNLQSLGYAGSVDAGNVDVAAAAAIDPKDMIEHWSQVQEGLNLQASGNAKEAKALLEQAVAEFPRDVYALRSLANMQGTSGEIDKAKATYLRAIELDPTEPATHVGLGQLLLAQRDIEGARARFQEALRIDPGYSITYVWLGQLAAVTLHFDEAEALFRRAIADDPGTAGIMAYNEMAWMFYRLGEREKARSAYEAALKIDEINGNARAGLGSLLADEGKLEEASKLFAEAIRFDPNQPIALAALAGSYDKLGEYEKAKATAQKSLEIRPDCAPAMNNLALIEKHLGNLPEAITLLNKVLEAYPGDVVARINLAQCYYAQRDVERAAQEYQQILKINPQVPIALANLGTYYQEKGELEKALDYLGRAVQADPSYAFGHGRYAVVLLQMGRSAEALTHFKRSLELDPDQQTRGQFEYQVELLEKSLPQASSSPTPVQPPGDGD